jgi:hypothetical protein
MLAPAWSRNLVTPARQGPQRSHHEWHIPQSNQPLARARDLVTHAARGADHGRNPGGRRARPARERRSQGPGSTRRCLDESAKRSDWRACSRADMRRPSSSVAARGCDGQNRKTARSTSTCAVQIAPSSLPDWVEQDGPVGHAHASRRSLKKTDLNPEEDASRTSIRRKPKAKKRHVQTG